MKFVSTETFKKLDTNQKITVFQFFQMTILFHSDSYPELEKFRKVQNHVRKTKQKYDKKKIDCIQKGMDPIL